MRKISILIICVLAVGVLQAQDFGSMFEDVSFFESLEHDDPSLEGVYYFYDKDLQRDVTLRVEESGEAIMTYGSMLNDRVIGEYSCKVKTTRDGLSVKAGDNSFDIPVFDAAGKVDGQFTKVSDNFEEGVDTISQLKKDYRKMIKKYL